MTFSNNNKDINILIIEDSEEDALLAVRAIKKRGFTVHYDLVSSLDAVRETLLKTKYDIILSDYFLLSFTGLEALAICKQLQPESIFILLSGRKGEEFAVTAIKAGANNFVVKENINYLGHVVENEIKELEQKKELKKSQETLLMLEKRLQLVSNSLPIALYALDERNRDHTLSWMSDNIYNIVGFPPQRFLENKLFWFSRIHPDNKEQIKKDYERIFDRNFSVSEYQWLCADGKYRWFSDYRMLSKDENNQIVGVIGAVLDVTHRKLIEERLFTLNKVSQLILKNLDIQNIMTAAIEAMDASFPDTAFAILSREENTQLFTIKSCNEPFTKISILGKENVIDKHLFPILYESYDAFSTDCLLFDSISMPLCGNSNSQALMLSGISSNSLKLNIVITALRNSSFPFNSYDYQFFKLITDHIAVAVQNAKLYEQIEIAYKQICHGQLIMMQHERLKALGEMASGIAHDINNAISPIVGFSELLLKTEKNLSPRARRFLQNIKDASSDIANIVMRMRSFFRKREESDIFAPVNLNQIAEQAIELSEPKWKDIPQRKGKEISIVTYFNKALPCISGIESEIRESILNIIINAVDALPDGGTITIKTSVFEDSMVGIEVSDNGVGMDEITRKRCTEPFFTTKGEQGTGLGLSSVYGTMQRHEGCLMIDSTPKRGTTVRLLFPGKLENIADSKDSTFDLFETAIPHLKILYIDDEPGLRNLIKELLENEGHEVVLAENGESGIAIFKEFIEKNSPFDIVFTDLGMPRMDGNEVAQNLKSISSSTPVILLTGWTFQSTEIAPISTDIDFTISKPPTINTIRRALSKCITFKRMV